jgi:nicotinamide mononucleotide transporter
MASLEEIVAVVLGVVAVYLSTRQNIWTYPLGIVSVFIYIFIFRDVKLYADMGLQVFFIVLQVYGWYEWLYGGEHKSRLHVPHTPRRVAVVNAVAVAVGTAVLGYFLHAWTDAALPYIDSFLAVLSMSGQFLLARKYFQVWHVWMAVNIGSIAMYAMKGLYFTMVLYGVYFVLAVMGYREWRKELKASSV